MSVTPGKVILLSAMCNYDHRTLELEGSSTVSGLRDLS